MSSESEDSSGSSATGSGSESEDDSMSTSTTASPESLQDATKTIKSLRYDIPAGFAEIEYNQKINAVSNEDLDKDDELWLIKMPLNFPVDKLQDNPLKYSGFTEINDAEEPKECDFIWKALLKEDLQWENSSQSVLLPSKQTGRLTSVGHFRGELSVKKSYKLPTVVKFDKSVPKGYDIPEGLRQRFLPFGADAPPCKKIRVKQEESSLNSSMETDKEIKKKKKKKKDKLKDKIKKESDLGTDTDVSMSDGGSAKKKKKKKKS